MNIYDAQKRVKAGVRLTLPEQQLLVEKYLESQKALRGIKAATPQKTRHVTLGRVRLTSEEGISMDPKTGKING